MAWARLRRIAGLTMAVNPPTRFAFAPLVYGIFPLPKIAIYPLMIVIFGLGDASKPRWSRSACST